MKYFWLTNIGLILWGSTVTSAFGECAVDVEFLDDHYADAAGCLVKVHGRWLVVRYLLSGKLGVPAGFAEYRETAQCAAHRETREEAGVEVVVGPLLNANNNDFYLYRCDPANPDLKIDTALLVPLLGRDEISEVKWTDPHDTNQDEWRFPEEYPVLLKMFDSLTE